MKRTFLEESTPAQSQIKKRKVTHYLHHTQPSYIPEPSNAELDYTGQHNDFFGQQLERAIALQCKGIGYDSMRPEAMEMFRGLVDGFMRNFTDHVRQSMLSARRTITVPHDWVNALSEAGMSSSSLLEPHLDMGVIPPSLLQPAFAPPKSADPPPPNLEDLLGPGLSGRAEKESKKYIPKHFPAFPSKHTWQATPVFTSRENDPRKIREKATEEGILAEQSLRKLMAAQKAGLQGDKARKQRRSKRMKKSDGLWQDAMKDLIAEEDEWAEKERTRQHFDDDEMEDSSWNQATDNQHKSQPERRKVNLQEGVHVNYNQKFWRKSARGF